MPRRSQTAGSEILMFGAVHWVNNRPQPLNTGSGDWQIEHLATGRARVSFEALNTEPVVTVSAIDNTNNFISLSNVTRDSFDVTNRDADGIDGQDLQSRPFSFIAVASE